MQRPELIKTNSAKSVDSDGTPKKKLLTYERKMQILDVFKKAIPGIAAERREVIKKNCQYAKLCILDAFQGRLGNGLANNSKKGGWIYTIFCIQTSNWLYNSVVIASALHTFSLFLEPENTCSNWWLVKLFQIIVMCVYVFDISMKMSYEGVQEYFSHDWQQLYAIVTVLDIADLLWNGCTFYTNPLRPVMGVLRARGGRRFFEVLKKMIPGMSHTLTPIFFFIFMIMIISSAIFDRNVREFVQSNYLSYNWFFLIFTNDAFDRMLPTHVHSYLPYCTYYFLAIYIGQKFLVSLIIGDTYDTFRSFVKKQVKKEKLKEMQGLVKAFAALDDRKEGFISSAVWKECLVAYNPEFSMEQIALYYELIAEGSTKNGVTVLQFLNLRNILNFKLTVKKNKARYIQNFVKDQLDAVNRYYELVKVPVSEKLSEAAEKVLKFLDEKEVLNKLNYVEVMAVSFSYIEYPLLRLPSAEASPMYFTPCMVMSLVYLCEYALRLAANKGVVSAVHKDNNAFSAIFLLGVVGTIVLTVMSFFGLNETVPFYIPFLGLLDLLPYRKLLLLARGMRCIRVVNMNEDLRTFNAALMDVLPALFETFGLTFVIIYMIGTFGHLLFGAYLQEWSTPLLAVVKASELTYMVNFLGSMEDVVENVHPLGAVFFVLFLILTLTVSNIALSIIIDLHSTVLDEKSTKEKKNEKKKLKLIFEKIVSAARARMFFKHGGDASLNFQNIAISQSQTSAVRHFVANSKNEGIKLEDIKACAKYSNINLVQHYLDEHRNMKDMNWTVEFLKALDEAGLHTQVEYEDKKVLFEAGQAADKIFLLIKGNAVMKKDRIERADLTATHFLGAECLQPNGVYTATCVIEKEATCIVLTQDDIAHKLDEETVGSIVRSVFKTHHIIETLYLAARKKFLRKSLTPRMYSELTRNSSHSQMHGEDDSTHSGMSTPRDGTSTPSYHAPKLHLLDPVIESKEENEMSPKPRPDHQATFPSS